MNGNAFLCRQGAMFIPCEGCTTHQQCGMHGHCYRDVCAAYNGQYNGSQNVLSQPVSWERGLQSLSSNFRHDYSMLREADSDGGECD